MPIPSDDSGRASDAAILEPGRSCMRIARTGRAAFLVDGAAYFEAVADAIERAERSVFLLGWDFHSQLRLRRGATTQDAESGQTLAELLDRVVSRRRGLHVHVLGWDFALIYALERELLPQVRFGWRTHSRIRFHLDDAHPIGASHHQKLVVVDDAVAFCGGLDLTACRWDTREHRPGDPRRCDPGFPDYSPFHDVQMVVDGDAAAALGGLARERWRRATGRRPRTVRATGDPWPPDLAADLKDVEVAVVRTEPAFDGRPEVREIESLYVAALRSAQRSIYIENQYFTATCIAEVLEERLREERGPEIVMVLPERCSGWLEEATMGILRNRLLRRLRDADGHGRLRAYHPALPGSDATPLVVHSKLLVVDERLVLVGSANLANRSMGFDTECGLAIEARGEVRVERAIARFRDGLLAEHLGVAAERVEREIAACGSIVAAIEKLRGGERTLAPVADADEPDWGQQLVQDGGLFDPERPAAIEDLRAGMRVQDGVGPARLLRIALPLLLLAGLVLAWRLTPLGDWITPERLLALALPLRESAAGMAVALGGFVVASLLLVPVTALIAASALLFGFGVGSAVAAAGALLSAASGYAVGAVLWRDALRRVAGGSFQHVRRWLGRSGFAAVAAVRVVPVAPFTVVNLVAGASHVPFGSFMLGTVIGMGPGLVVLALLADRAVAALAEPGWRTVGLAAALAGLLVASTFALRRWLGRAAARRGEARTDGRDG